MTNISTMSYQVRAVMCLVACLFVSACSSLPKGDVSLDLGIKDRGVASWYGKAFHGKVAANGEVFDMTAYTAAHRKLPLGSVVQVMNVDTGKSVQVRITDRGPYVGGRMMDLSHAAARDLGMVDAGTAVVQIEVVGEAHLIRPAPSRQAPALIHVLHENSLSRHDRPSREHMAQPPVAVRM